MRIMRNKEPWELDEIELLDKLLQSGEMPLGNIAQGLGRSEMAVKHAVTKMIYQQLLDHTPEKIADRYERDVTWVENVVDPKYRIVYNPDAVPSGGGTRMLAAFIMKVMYVTIGAGMAYYTWLLQKNGFGQEEFII